MHGQERRQMHRFRTDGADAPSSLTLIDGRGGDGCTISRGETAFVSGLSSLTGRLLHAVAFRSLTVSEGAVLWIDGGVSFDPYVISELAERCGYRTEELLSRIRIARAFTAHQMEAISRSAMDEARKSAVSAVIVSSVAELFTGDVGWREGMDLLRSTIGNVKKLTEEFDTWTLMSSAVSVSSSTDMEHVVNGNCSKVINVGMENDDLQVESDGFAMTVSRWNGMEHQRSLLEFGDRRD